MKKGVLYKKKLIINHEYGFKIYEEHIWFLDCQNVGEFLLLKCVKSIHFRAIMCVHIKPKRKYFIAETKNELRK
jgi:hypothetical protein